MSNRGTASCNKAIDNFWGQRMWCELAAHHDPIPCLYTLTMNQWMNQMINRWQRP